VQFVYQNFSGVCEEDAGGEAVDYFTAYFNEKYNEETSALVGMYCSVSRYSTF
jgi:hypothetical protein